MGMRSKCKGKRGELEAAKELSKVLGVQARRGQQFCGGHDSPDVITELSGLHLEVKRTEAFRLYAAIEQAACDAGASQVPVVLHRRNHCPWVIVLRLADLPAFINELVKEIPQHDPANSSQDHRE